MTSTDDSARAADARQRSEQRLRRQRDTLRPLGVAVIAIVIISTATSHPAPGFHGRGIALTAALVAFVGALAFAIRDPFAKLSFHGQAAVIVVIGAGGVAIAGLQPHGASELASGAAVFLAVTRLPPVAGVVLATVTTVALGLVSALVGSSASSVIADTLLCLLLSIVARSISHARASQNQTEILFAQLEDARDEQARAAAIAERGRIASELHDVLAHSLSGAAIQLQGARKLAERDRAEPEVRSAIDRASELVKDGLVSARQAVGALRGEELPTVDQLAGLVSSYRADMNADVTLTIAGEARALPPDASLALYRGAQEALTNAARYAPGAPTSVELRYEDGTTRLRVENGAGSGQPLSGVGGGRGLEGMRERIERAGGTADAGPTADGWRVDLEVPA